MLLESALTLHYSIRCARGFSSARPVPGSAAFLPHWTGGVHVQMLRPSVARPSTQRKILHGPGRGALGPRSQHCTHSPLCCYNGRLMTGDVPTGALPSSWVRHAFCVLQLCPLMQRPDGWWQPVPPCCLESTWTLFRARWAHTATLGAHWCTGRRLERFDWRVTSLCRSFQANCINVNAL